MDNSISVSAQQLIERIVDSSLALMGSLSSVAGLSLASTCAIVFVYVHQRRKRARQQSFPGPPGAQFFWGHLFTMPGEYQWKVFGEWSKSLGNIFQLSIVGRPMIVVNTAEEARELLEKRGANNSDRPKTIVHGEMMGFSRIISFLNYDEEFKLQRRLVHAYLNPQAVSSQHEHQTLQARIFLKNLLKSPEKFTQHASRMSAANIVKMAYGYDIDSDDDELTRAAVESSARLTKAGVPGMTFVDFFPILRYFPTWFPGAGCMKDMDLAQKAAKRLIEFPYDKIQADRAAGIPRPSLVESMLSDYENSGVIDKDYEVTMQYVGGAMYGGGVQTTDAVTLTFFLMLARNRHALEAAHNEIDSVIGLDRLPDLRDRPNLPYIECILKETLRLNPSTPLGVPHASMTDDVYDGKFIPAGSYIVANIWQMMRDERYFPQPEEFRPERHLNRVREELKNGRSGLSSFSPDDPSSLVFGFGRRICQGRYFADATTWLAIVHVLAVFDILPAIDSVSGKETIPPADFLSGFTSKPKPFACRIVPRSQQHAALIEMY